MVGIYSPLNAIPTSVLNVVFKVKFPADFSTACMERVQCVTCWFDEDCTAFQEDVVSAFLTVRKY